MEKSCSNHPDSPAVAGCRACDKQVCLMCSVEVGGDIFCSAKCVEIHKEVQEWIKPMARPEEWNPLADASVSVRSTALPEDESLLDMSRVGPKPPAPSQDESPDIVVVPGTRRKLIDKTCAAHANTPAVAVCMKCGHPFCSSCAVETSWGNFCSMACSVAFGAPGEPQPAASRRIPAAPLIIGFAAVLAVVAVIAAVLSSLEGPPTTPPSQVARVEPSKADPPKAVIPKPEPAKPAPPQVEPPKAPVAKVEPPRPEPPKVEPPKPVPPKVEPPTAPVAKVEPPKPEPPKVEPPKPVPPKTEPQKAPVAKTEPPKPEPPVPEPPKPEPAKPVTPRYLVVARDPWAGVQVGSWYRMKTSDSRGERYTDIGLKERGAGYVVLSSQTKTIDSAEGEQYRHIDLEELSPLETRRLYLRGVTHDIDIVEGKGKRAPPKWVLTDGRYAGVVLPEEWAGDKGIPRGFDEQTIEVKDRAFDCLIVEATLSATDKVVRTWLSLDYPPGPVRMESEGARSVLVDFGDDWSKRPPFPEIAKAEVAKVTPPPAPPKPEPPKPEPPKAEPPKPEPPKVEPPKPESPKAPVAKVEPPKPESPKPAPPKPEPPKNDPAAMVQKMLNEAAALIRETTPLYQQVADAMQAKVSDKAALRELRLKAETVYEKLEQARVLYYRVKKAVPDPAVIENRIKRIEDLQDAIDDCIVRIDQILK